MAENARSRAFFSRRGGSCRRSAFSPQKVKNIDTSSPIDAAALARMNEASTRSNSPENTTNDFLSLSRAAAPPAAISLPPLRNRAA